MWNRAKDERKTWYLTYLLTHDFSFKEISLLDLKDYFLKKYWSISALFIRQNTSILKRKTLFNILYELSIQIVSAIIIGVAIMSAYVGEILVGNVMSYIRSVGLVQTNSQAIMSNIYTVYSSTLYMDMLFQFLNYCVKEDSSEKIVMKEPINKIDIKELSFSYNGKTKVLDKINLTLVQGEKVALVGPNGSGKSTFLKILAGLYNIEEGEILINGRSLKDLDIRSYRSKMSVLFQDFVKYELSLRENIGFGDIQNLNNDEKMVQMLHKLQTKFLQTDNGSYNLDLQLGNWFEDGCQLSQGQWQKIALGRVYFRDASFYILDEPNAALDTVSEREVFEKFFELSKDKIGVFISHRLNAAKMADKIIVMDKGKIVGIVFTGIFMLLRTYAGGVHLNSFGTCYVCSVAVQTLVMYFNNKYKFTVSIAWILILMSAILILKAAPVESINRELDNTEKEHCQKVTMKILMGVIAFAICCTVGLIQDMLSLISLTTFIILISQYVGILKYKIENSKNKRR